MKIAVLSGKGGAGKTMVAVNLAATKPGCTYVDCDVEEPNGRLFWKPQRVRTQEVFTAVPEVDGEKCSGCRRCVEACRFHALLFIRNQPRLFESGCHSCGLCEMVCPEQAIREKKRPIGRVEVGVSGETRTITGILNPGEGSGVGVIRAALEQAESDETVVIDCPPGSACTVTESIQDADFCILVCEATAFGFHNFKMVHELAKLLGRRCGVIVNKAEGTYEPLERYCREEKLPVLARIPYDGELAKLGAEGRILAEKPEISELFRGVWAQIGGEAS